MHFVSMLMTTVAAAALVAFATAGQGYEFQTRNSDSAAFSAIGRNVRCWKTPMAVTELDGASSSSSSSSSSLVNSCIKNHCKDSSCSGVGVTVPRGRPFISWPARSSWIPVLTTTTNPSGSSSGNGFSVGAKIWPQPTSSPPWQMSMGACKAKCLLLSVCSYVSYSKGGNCVLYKSKTSNGALHNNVVSSGTLLQRTRWREAHDVRLAAKYATVDAPAGKEECRQRCGKDSSQCPRGFLFEHQRCSSAWVTRPVSSATLPDSCVQKVYATIELCKAMCAADAQCREGGGFIHTVERFGFSSPEFGHSVSAGFPGGAAFWTSKTDDERAVYADSECLKHKGVGWRAMTKEEAERHNHYSGSDRLWRAGVPAHPGQWAYRYSASTSWGTANPNYPSGEVMCIKPPIQDRSLTPACLLIRSTSNGCTVPAPTSQHSAPFNATAAASSNRFYTQVHYRLEKKSDNCEKALRCHHLVADGILPTVETGTWPASTTSVYGGEELLQHTSFLQQLASFYPRSQCKKYGSATPPYCTLPYSPRSPTEDASNQQPLELGFRRDPLLPSNGKPRIPLQGDFDTINGNICMAHQPQFVAEVRCSSATLLQSRFDLTAATEELRVQECSRICQGQGGNLGDGKQCRLHGFVFQRREFKPDGCTLLTSSSDCSNPSSGGTVVVKYRNVAVRASAEIKCDTTPVNGTRRVVDPLPCTGGSFVNLATAFESTDGKFSQAWCSKCPPLTWTPVPDRKCTPAEPSTSWVTDGVPNANIEWQHDAGATTLSQCELSCKASSTCSGYKLVDKTCHRMVVAGNGRRAAIVRPGKRAMLLFSVKCSAAVGANGACASGLQLSYSDPAYPHWKQTDADATYLSGHKKYTGQIPRIFYGNEETIDAVMATAELCVMRGVGRVPDDNCAYGNGMGTVYRARSASSSGSSHTGSGVVYRGSVDLPPLAGDSLEVYLMLDSVDPGQVAYVAAAVASPPAPGVGTQFASRFTVNEAPASSFTVENFNPDNARTKLDRSKYLSLPASPGSNQDYGDAFRSQGTVAMASVEKHTAAGSTSLSAHQPTPFSCSALMTAVPSPADNAWGDMRDSVIGSCMATANNNQASKRWWKPLMPVLFADGLKGGRDYVLRSGGVAAYVKDLKFEFAPYLFENAHGVRYPFHFTLDSTGGIATMGGKETSGVASTVNAISSKVLTSASGGGSETQVLLARKDDPPEQAKSCVVVETGSTTTATFWASDVPIMQTPKVKTNGAWALLADAVCAEQKGPEWRSASTEDADYYDPSKVNQAVRFNEDDRRWRESWAYWSYSGLVWKTANALGDKEKYQKPVCVNVPQKKRHCQPLVAVLVQWPHGQPFPVNVIHDVTYPDSAQVSITTVTHEPTAALGKLHVTMFKSAAIRRNVRYAVFYRKTRPAAQVSPLAPVSYAATCPLVKVYYSCLPKTQCNSADYYMTYSDSLSQTTPGQCQLRRTCPPGVARMTTSLYTDSVCLLPVSPIPMCRNLIAFMTACTAVGDNDGTAATATADCSCTARGFSSITSTGGMYNLLIFRKSTHEQTSGGGGGDDGASIDGGYQLSLYDFPKEGTVPYVPALLQSGKTCAESSLVNVTGKTVGHAGQGMGCVGDSLEWVKQVSTELTSHYKFYDVANTASISDQTPPAFGHSASSSFPGGVAFWSSNTADERAVYADSECRKHNGPGWRALAMAEAEHYNHYGAGKDQLWRSGVSAHFSQWGWRAPSGSWSTANFNQASGEAVCVKPPASTLDECKQQCASDALCRERGFSFVPRSGNGTTTLGDCRFPTAASKVSMTVTTTASLYRKPGCVYMKVPHYQYKTGHQARTLSFLECRFECDKQPGCPDKGFTWSDAAGNDCRLPQEGANDLQLEATASAAAAYYSVSSVPSPSSLTLHYEKLDGFGHGASYTSYQGLSAEECRIKCQQVAGCPAKGFSWYKSSSGSRGCRIPFPSTTTGVSDGDTIERWADFESWALYRLPAYRVVPTDGFEVAPTLTEQDCKQRWRQVATAFSTLSSTLFGFLSIGYGHVQRDVSSSSSAQSCSLAVQTEDVLSTAPNGGACKKAVSGKKSDPVRCTECRDGFVLEKIHSDCSGRCLPKAECRVVKRGVKTPPLVSVNTTTTATTSLKRAVFYRNEDEGLAGTHRVVTVIKGWGVVPRQLTAYECASACGPSTRFFVRGTASMRCDSPIQRCECTCVAVGSPVCKQASAHQNLTLYDVAEATSADETSSYRVHLRDARCGFDMALNQNEPNITRFYADSTKSISSVAACAQECAATHNTPFFEFPNWNGAANFKMCSYAGCSACVCLQAGKVELTCHRSATAKVDLFRVIGKDEERLIRSKNVKVCPAGTYSRDGTIPKLLRYCKSDAECCSDHDNTNSNGQATTTCKSQPFSRCVTVRKGAEAHENGCMGDTKGVIAADPSNGWTLWRRNNWTEIPNMYLVASGASGSAGYIESKAGSDSLEKCKNVCQSSRRCRALGFYVTIKGNSLTCYIPDPEILITKTTLVAAPIGGGHVNNAYAMETWTGKAGAKCSELPHVAVEVAAANTSDACRLHCLRNPSCAYFGYSFNDVSKRCLVTSPAFQPWIQVCAPVIPGASSEAIATTARTLTWPCTACPKGKFAEFPGAKECSPYNVASRAECHSSRPVYINASATFGGECVSEKDAAFYDSPQDCRENTYKKIVYSRVRNPTIHEGYRDVADGGSEWYAPRSSSAFFIKKLSGVQTLDLCRFECFNNWGGIDEDVNSLAAACRAITWDSATSGCYLFKNRHLEQSSGAPFQLTRFVDGSRFHTRSFVNGKDIERTRCFAKTACPPGQYASFADDSTRDNLCRSCPAGKWTLGGVGRTLLRGPTIEGYSASNQGNVEDYLYAARSESDCYPCSKSSPLRYYNYAPQIAGGSTSTNTSLLRDAYNRTVTVQRGVSPVACCPSSAGLGATCGAGEANGRGYFYPYTNTTDLQNPLVVNYAKNFDVCWHCESCKVGYGPSLVPSPTKPDTPEFGVCLPCRKDTQSRPVVGSVGGAHVCEACPVNEYTQMAGATGCLKCSIAVSDPTQPGFQPRCAGWPGNDKLPPGFYSLLSTPATSPPPPPPSTSGNSSSTNSTNSTNNTSSSLLYDPSNVTVLSGWDHIVAVSKVSEFMRQRLASELGDGTRETPWLHQKWPTETVYDQIAAGASMQAVQLGCPAGYGMYSGDHYTNTRNQATAASLPAEPTLIEKVGPNGTSTVEVVPADAAASGGGASAPNVHNTITSWRFPVKPQYSASGNQVHCNRHSDCGNAALSPDSTVVAADMVCRGDARAFTFCGAPAAITGIRVCTLCRSERFAVTNAGILGAQCIDSNNDNALPINSRCGAFGQKNTTIDTHHVGASRRCPAKSETFCSGLTGMCTPCLEESSAIETTYTDDMAAIYMPCDARNRCGGDNGAAVTYSCAVPGTRMYCDMNAEQPFPAFLEGMVSPLIKAAMTSRPPTRGICMPCAPFVKNLAVLPFLGWSLCVPCLPGFVSKEGDPSCRACPANAVPQITAGANGQLAAYTECAACNRDSHGVVNFKFGKNPDLGNAYGDQGSVFGVTVCIACNSVGMSHYRDPTTGQCRTCEAGKASSSGTAGNAIRPACDVCAPGYYRNETGGGGGEGGGSFDFRCQKCPAGKFTSNVKDIAKLPFNARCKDCPAGRSTDGRDGLVYNESGQPCTKCTGQTVAKNPGTAKCETCQEMGNEMVRNAEGTDCRACAAGTSRSRLVDQNVSTFVPDYGTQWRAVLRGVRLSPSPDGCVWCAPGYHRANANDNDNKGCEACPVGRYQPEPKGTTCLSCPSGRYTDATAQVRCKTCPLGRATRHELQPAPAETLYETGATWCIENCQTTFAWRFAEQFDGVEIANTAKGPLGNLYPSLAEGSKACCIDISTGEFQPCPRSPEDSDPASSHSKQWAYLESLGRPFYGNSKSFYWVTATVLYILVFSLILAGYRHYRYRWWLYLESGFMDHSSLARTLHILLPGFTEIESEWH